MFLAKSCAGLRRLGRGSYRVLPGGLVCVANEETEAFRPGKPGGSKDTWVLYGQEDRPAAARAAEIATEAHPARTDLPAGAPTICWLGRYAERVEANVRLVCTLLPALAAEEDFHHSLGGNRLAVADRARYLPPELASASLAEQLSGVKKLFADMCTTARAASISAGIWGSCTGWRGVCGSVFRWTHGVCCSKWKAFSPAMRPPISRRYDAQSGLLDDAVALSAISGLLMENTTRGQGWRFLDNRRRMERALQMGELLRACVARAQRTDRGESSGVAADRRQSDYLSERIHYRFADSLVLELLLADESNPRSVGFQLAALYDHLTQVPQREEPGLPLRERCHVFKVLTAVGLAQARICPADGQASRTLKPLLSK